MQNRPKILFISNDLTNTGAPRVALSLIKELKADYDFQMVSVVDGSLNEEAGAEVPLRVLQPWGSPPPPLWKRGTGRIYRPIRNKQWIKQLRDWKPDLVYINTICGLKALSWWEFDDIPVLLHLHELNSFIRLMLDSISESTVHRAQRYITVSQEIAQIIGDMDVAREKISVIPPFIQAERGNGSVRIRENEFPDSYKLPEKGPYIVGGCGTDNWRKGFWQFLEVAVEFRHLFPEQHVEFHWYGMEGNDDLYRMRETMKRYEVEDTVRLFPSQPNVVQRFAQFDVFAATAVEDPFPLVVLENMALATPVACFKNGGGMAEQVGDTGLVIPRFSAMEMAREIGRLFEDPTRYESLARATQERVFSQFTTEAIIPRIKAVIEETRALKAG